MSISTLEKALDSSDLASKGLARAHAAPASTQIFEATLCFDPMDWESVRAQFNLDPRLAHIANFYLASYPKSVRDAIEHYRAALDNDPHSFLNDNMFAKPEQALWRHVANHVARYVGGHIDEIALTGNTTLGLSLIYNGLVLRPGQEVLTTTHEFYPHYEAIRLATQKWGGAMRQISLYDESSKASVDEMVDRLISAIRPETRVLAITWVHSGTGVVLPVSAVSAALESVNRRRDESDRVILVVDGVHGFGILDEDVAGMGCDFFAAGTHKWILGPHGTGIVWGKAESWPLIQPTIPSLMAREPGNAWRESRTPVGPVQAAWISPGGFLAYEHLWSMAEGFRFHERIGRTRVADRILELNGRLKDALRRDETCPFALATTSRTLRRICLLRCNRCFTPRSPSAASCGRSHWQRLALRHPLRQVFGRDRQQRRRH